MNCSDYQFSCDNSILFKIEHFKIPKDILYS